MATTTTFMDLVQMHDRNIQSQIRKRLDTEDDPSVPMSDWVMVHKVEKHIASGNQRKAAQYAVMRLEEDPTPLSPWARERMRRTPLKANKKAGQILFTNEEGDLRAFNFVRAK